MLSTVILVTSRPSFEEICRASISKLGLKVKVVNVEELVAALSPNAPVLFDAGCDLFDEDELLTGLGLAQALGAVPAVALAGDGSMAEIEYILDELCPGLVARAQAEIARVVQMMARRCDKERGRCFEYLTVSPRPGELLAIWGDGTAALLPRPIGPDDDGKEVTSVVLAEDATSATLTLSSGRQVELRAAAFSGSAVEKDKTRAAVGGAGGEVTVDAHLGARLRRLRLAAGLTQAELARRTGIQRPNIARLESGRHTPSLETLGRLASAIGVPAARVLVGD